MEVVSICALRAGSVLWEDARGATTLTVVAKATYALRPLESPLAASQDAPNEADEHWDDDEQKSLHAPSDLAPFKRRADVLLVGHAFAPGALPTRSLVARLVVGEVDKSIEVHGERTFTADGHVREGAPFVKMPLRWERAAGGPDTANPVGVRVEGRSGASLPSLQPVGIRVTSASDYIPPLGFGPIAASWPTRLARLSVRAAGWDFRRWRDARLPPDLDPSFFNVAPSDQQLDVLRPGASIALENLHPAHPRLVTTLASATPRAVIERESGLAEEVGMRCDTLLIDTDRGACSLTWRAQIPIDHARRVVRVILTTTRAAAQSPGDTARPRTRHGTVEMPAQEDEAPKPAIRAEPAKPIEDAIEETIEGSASSMPALPFRVGRSALAGMVLGVPAHDGDSWSETTDEHTSPSSEVPSNRALPFFADERDDLDEEETHTDLPRDLAQLVAGAVAPVAITQPWRAITEDVTADLPAKQAQVEEAPEVETVEMDPANTTSPAIRRNSLPSLPFQRAFAAAPPPMIGPLATPEMEAARAPEPEPAKVDATPEEGAAPAPQPEPELPLDAYPLEKCAAIAASIARSKDRTDRILADHDLAHPLWTKLDRHWIDHVRASSTRGKTAPLKAYDAAYVGQLEKERGPIRADEYARLVVAVERASADEALSALDLPRGALVRVQRVWLGRTAGDPDLGRLVRRAIDAAREA